MCNVMADILGFKSPILLLFFLSLPVLGSLFSFFPCFFLVAVFSFSLPVVYSFTLHLVLLKYIFDSLLLPFIG